MGRWEGKGGAVLYSQSLALVILSRLLGTCCRMPVGMAVEGRWEGKGVALFYSHSH